MVKKLPTKLEIHGHVRVDDYYWLRERDNPEVIRYLNEENDYAVKEMAHVRSFEEKLFEEIKGRFKQTDMSVPYRLDDYYYYMRYEESKEYAIYARKLSAEPVQVPLRNDRYDLEALLAAVTDRTKLVYVCDPNNPTGTMSSRVELDAYFERVPDHVVTVLDQAYFEYVDEPDYTDGIEEYFKTGRQVVVLRTFSKIYGLAGARVGYGVGPAELVTALGKTRRAFDLATPAQVAALASVDSPGEVERRRRANAEGRAELERILTDAGYRVAAAPVGNFVFVDLGEDAQPWFDALLREGVIVRPLAGFGAPNAIRITVGTPEDHAFLAEALARVRTAAAAS
jgi:histidinol-phosphate aminotransferase